MYILTEKEIHCENGSKLNLWTRKTEGHKEQHWQGTKDRETDKRREVWKDTQKEGHNESHTNKDKKKELTKQREK